jgi:hypothetical protein
MAPPLHRVPTEVTVDSQMWKEGKAMKKKLHYPLIAILIFQLIISFGSGAAARPAESNSVTPAADHQVDQILIRIDTRRSAFRRSFDLAMARTRRDNMQEMRGARETFSALETALRDFRQRYSEGRAEAGDIAEVMNHARSLDQFFAGGFVDARSRQDWSMLYSELNQLARQYDHTAAVPDRGTRRYGARGRSDQDSRRLTGTYRLDRTRSEDSVRVAERVTRNLSPEQQERIRNLITRRLDAPEMLAIDRDGRRITVISNSAPEVTFEADGQTRVEQTRRGRTVRVNAAVVGDQLVVSSTGDRGNDFRVTFDPIGNGERLSVTRQLDIESLGQPVIVASTYDKTSEIAESSIYSGRPAVAERTGPRGVFTVPDGTQIVGSLNENLVTQRANAGDRFTLTVQSPREYEGATIEGYIVDADRSGRIAGRSEIALNFERIRMRNGSSHAFEGIIESVRTPRGESIRVDNEGTVSEKSGQTQRTVTRTGIGAAIGAIVGAIAGGGSGAAIGAAVGAGAGAGSVILEGRDDLELLNGTQFTIRSSAPRNRDEPIR